MNFNRHSDMEGKHAVLGASNYHWIYYDDAKFIDICHNLGAVQRGIADHDFAKRCIQRMQKLPRNHQTLNMFVNDGVGFRMTPEQVLAYSDNCYGTADAISFYNDVLRINDLKTGVTPAKMDQLRIYAALFCMEYGIDPIDIPIELRIYQNDEIGFENADPSEVRRIMEKAQHFDRLYEEEIKYDNN